MVAVVCLKAFSVVVSMYRGFWVVTRRHIFGVNRRFRTTFCPFFRVNEHETNEYLGSGARFYRGKVSRSGRQVEPIPEVAVGDW
jgi:hypothetical protein